MTVFAPSSYEEVGGDARRGARTRRAGRAAVAEDAGAPRRGRPGRPRPHRPARCGRATTCACSRSARWSRPPRRPPALLDARGVHAHGVGRPRRPARPAHARRRAPPPARGHRRGRHRRGRRRERCVAGRARPAGDATSGRRASLTLGTPLAYLPHGKPADLLANLGLDGPGIAATVAEGPRRRRLTVPRHTNRRQRRAYSGSTDASCGECGASSPRCDVETPCAVVSWNDPRQLLRRLCSSTASCTSSPTSTRRRRASGSTRSTRSSTSAAGPGPATCSPGSWSGPGSRASASGDGHAPTTSTPSRPSRSRGSRATRSSSAASAPTSAGTRWRWSTARTTGSTASAGTCPRSRRRPALYDVGFNHFFRGKRDGGFGDQVFFQGHAAPGIYARAFLEGRLTEEQLDRFRREVDGGGLPSYPHPRRMPEFWEFPTVSMGLGPLNAIAQARFNRYLLAPRDGRHERGEGVGVRRRRRDGRARVDGRAVDRGTRAARQPDLRRQLQPAAPRRPGARQRQDHPGARGDLPRRGLERHQGDLGPRAGTSCSPATSTACSSTR